MVGLIKKILSVDIHQAEKIYKKELEKLGLLLYNKRANGCGNCLLEIYLLLNKNGVEMAERKNKEKKRVAQLKDNVVLRVPSMGVTWTNDSPLFTDEAAAKVLQKFPLLKSRFEVLPIKKQASKNKPVEKKVVKDTPQEPSQEK